MRVFGDSGKSRLAFGLALYVLFVLAMALRLGILPDEPETVREGRASLCEAVAVNTAILLGQNDLIQVENIMSEIVRRDDDLESAGIRLADGSLLIEAGGHQASWQSVDGVYSTETQIQVPLGSEDETWGILELRFRPATRQGTLRSSVPPLVQLLAFVGVACFVGFRSFLGSPRALPSHRIVSARDERNERSLVSLSTRKARADELLRNLEAVRDERPQSPHAPRLRARIFREAGFSWAATWIETEDWGEMSRDEPPTTDEQRESTRFAKEPETDFAVVCQTPGDDMQVSVHNESLGGLSLTMQEVSNLQLGHEVDIVYAGSTMRGTVKHVRPQSDGTFLVGLLCRRLS